MEEDEECNSDTSDRTVLLTEYYDEPQKNKVKRRRLSSLHDRSRHTDEYISENEASDDTNDNTQTDKPLKKQTMAINIDRYFATINNADVHSCDSNNQDNIVSNATEHVSNEIKSSDNGIICLDSDDEAQAIDTKENQAVNISKEKVSVDAKLKVLKPAAINSRRSTIDIFENNFSMKNGTSSRQEKNKQAKIRVLKPFVINSRRATISFDENNFSRICADIQNDINIESEKIKEPHENNSGINVNSTNVECNEKAGVDNPYTTVTATSTSDLEATSTSDLEATTIHLEAQSVLRNVDPKSNANVNSNKRTSTEDLLLSNLKRIRVHTEANKDTPYQDIEVTEKSQKETEKLVTEDQVESKTEELLSNNENKAHLAKNNRQADKKSAESIDNGDRDTNGEANNKEKSNTAFVAEKIDEECEKRGSNKVHTEQDINAAFHAKETRLEQVTFEVVEQQETNSIQNEQVVRETRGKQGTSKITDKQPNSYEPECHENNYTQAGLITTETLYNQGTNNKQDEQIMRVAIDNQEIASIQEILVIREAPDNQQTNKIQDGKMTNEVLDYHEMTSIRDGQITREEHDKQETSNTQESKVTNEELDYEETSKIQDGQITSETLDNQDANRRQYEQTIHEVLENLVTNALQDRQEIKGLRDLQTTGKLDHQKDTHNPQNEHNVSEANDQQLTEAIQDEQVLNDLSNQETVYKVHNEPVPTIFHNFKQTNEVQDNSNANELYNKHEKYNLDNDEITRDSQVAQITNKTHLETSIDYASQNESITREAYTNSKSKKHDVTMKNNAKDERNKQKKIIIQCEQITSEIQAESSQVLKKPIIINSSDNSANRNSQDKKLTNERYSRQKTSKSKHMRESLITRDKLKINVVSDEQEISRIRCEQTTKEMPIPATESEVLKGTNRQSDKQETCNVPNYILVTSNANNKQETSNVSERHEKTKEHKDQESNNRNERASPCEKELLLKFQIGFFTLLKEFIKDWFPESAKSLQHLIQSLLTKTINVTIETDIQYSCPNCSLVSTYSPNMRSKTESDKNIAMDGSQKCTICLGIRNLHTSFLEKYLCKRITNKKKDHDNRESVANTQTETIVDHQNSTQNISQHKEHHISKNSVDGCETPSKNTAKNGFLITKKRTSQGTNGRESKRMRTDTKQITHQTHLETSIYHASQDETITREANAYDISKNLDVPTEIQVESTQVQVEQLITIKTPDKQKRIEASDKQEINRLGSEQAIRELQIPVTEGEVLKDTNRQSDKLEPNNLSDRQETTEEHNDLDGKVRETGNGSADESSNLQANSEEVDSANEITNKSLNECFVKLKSNSHSEVKQDEQVIQRKNNKTSSESVAKRNINLRKSPECSMNKMNLCYVCPLCTCEYVYPAKLLQHMRDRHNYDPDDTKITKDHIRRKCSFCGILLRLNRYNKHVEKQHPRKFKEIFTVNDNLNTNGERSTDRGAANNKICRNTGSNKISERIEFHCLICKETLSTYYAARAHRKQKHPEFKNRPLYRKIVIRGDNDDQLEIRDIEIHDKNASANNSDQPSSNESGSRLDTSEERVSSCDDDSSESDDDGNDGNETVRTSDSRLSSQEKDEEGYSSEVESESSNSTDESYSADTSSEPDSVNTLQKINGSLLVDTECTADNSDETDECNNSEESSVGVNNEEYDSEFICDDNESAGSAEEISASENTIKERSQPKRLFKNGATEQKHITIEQYADIEKVNATQSDDEALKTSKYAVMNRKIRLSKLLSDDDTSKSDEVTEKHCDRQGISKQVEKEIASDKHEAGFEENNGESSPNNHGDKEIASEDETVKVSERTIKKKKARLTKLFGNDNHELVENCSKNLRIEEICKEGDLGNYEETKTVSEDETIKPSKWIIRKRAERLSRLFGEEFEASQTENKNNEDYDQSAKNSENNELSTEQHDSDKGNEIRNENLKEVSNNLSTYLDNNIRDVDSSEQYEEIDRSRSEIPEMSKCGNYDENSLNKKDLQQLTSTATRKKNDGNCEISNPKASNIDKNNEKRKTLDSDRREIDMIDCLLEELGSQPNGDQQNECYNETDDQVNEVPEAGNDMTHQVHSDSSKTSNLQAGEANCFKGLHISNIVSITTKILIYICRDCYYATDTYDDVIRHCQNHYIQIEDPVTYCDICQIKYDMSCYKRHAYTHYKYFQFIKIKYSYRWLFSNWHAVFEDNNMPLSLAEDVQIRSIYKTFCVKMKVKEDGPWQSALYRCAKCNTCVQPRDIEAHVQQKCKFINYPCSVCDLIFLTYDMQSHHEIYHSNSTETFKIIAFNEEEDQSFNLKLIQAKVKITQNRVVDIFKCLCGLCFISLKVFKVHFLDCEAETNNGTECSRCPVSRRFPPGEIQDHMSLHHGLKEYKFKVHQIAFQAESNNNDNTERDTVMETNDDRTESERTGPNVDDLAIKREMMKYELTQNNDGDDIPTGGLQSADFSLSAIEQDLKIDLKAEALSQTIEVEEHTNNKDTTGADLARINRVFSIETLSQVNFAAEETERPVTATVENNLQIKNNLLEECPLSQETNKDQEFEGQIAGRAESNMQIESDHRGDEVSKEIIVVQDSQDQNAIETAIENDQQVKRGLKENVIPHEITEDTQDPINTEISAENDSHIKGYLQIKNNLPEEYPLSQETNEDQEFEGQIPGRAESNMQIESDHRGDKVLEEIIVVQDSQGQNAIETAIENDQQVKRGLTENVILHEITEDTQDPINTEISLTNDSHIKGYLQIKNNLLEECPLSQETNEDQEFEGQIPGRAESNMQIESDHRGDKVLKEIIVVQDSQDQNAIETTIENDQQVKRGLIENVILHEITEDTQDPINTEISAENDSHIKGYLQIKNNLPEECPLSQETNEDQEFEGQIAGRAESNMQIESDHRGDKVLEEIIVVQDSQGQNAIETAIENDQQVKRGLTENVILHEITEDTQDPINTEISLTNDSHIKGYLQIKNNLLEECPLSQETNEDQEFEGQIPGRAESNMQIESDHRGDKVSKEIIVVQDSQDQNAIETAIENDQQVKRGLIENVIPQEITEDTQDPINTEISAENDSHIKGSITETINAVHDSADLIKEKNLDNLQTRRDLTKEVPAQEIYSVDEDEEEPITIEDSDDEVEFVGRDVARFPAVLMGSFGNSRFL